MFTKLMKWFSITALVLGLFWGSSAGFRIGVEMVVFVALNHRPDSGKRVAVKLPGREDTKVNSLPSGLQPEQTFLKEAPHEI